MRMLVSGSNGLIGRALVARLEADGHSVHRLVRGAPALGVAAVDFAARRLDLSGLPGGTLDRIDAVFNLSGEHLSPRRWSQTKRERVRASRVVTTDLIKSEQLGKQITDILLELAHRGYIRHRKFGSALIRCRQRLAIELSVHGYR